jgi:hypothetical protein
MNPRRSFQKAAEVGKKYRSGEYHAESEMIAHNAIGSLETTGNKKLLFSLIAAGAAGNAIIWLAMIFFHSAFSVLVDLILNLPKIGGIIFVIPFILGFLPVFALCRLRLSSVNNEPPPVPGLMNTFSQREQSDKGYQIWIISGMAGGLNVCLLILAYHFL